MNPPCFSDCMVKNRSSPAAKQAEGVMGNGGKAAGRETGNW